MSFTCRVCGSTEYERVIDQNDDDLYWCKGCSVNFMIPDQFSVPKLKWTRLDMGAIEPEKNKELDAGYDLFAAYPYVVEPGKTVMVKTEIAIELPPVYEAQVRARSGLAKKKGIQVANSPGTIDNGYRNGIGVLLYNSSDVPFEVEQGDRVAQLIVAQSVQIDLEEVNELSETDRGLSGFGDSGIKGKIKN